MSNKSYYELLKDPRWQRARLEVMEAADFKCGECGDSESTLNVHHGYYEKDTKPWEYIDSTLHCLCESCHQEYHHRMERIKFLMGTLPLQDLDAVLGYLQGIMAERGPFGRIQLKSIAQVVGFCDRDKPSTYCDIASILDKSENYTTLSEEAWKSLKAEQKNLEYHNKRAFNESKKH
jgi:hypothetical protein